MPAIKARAICETALRLLGVAAAEQPIDAFMADAALDALNTLIDSWATEKLLTYTRPHYALTLEPGRRTYSWGFVPGEGVPADISAPAPVRLEIAMLNIGGSPAQEWPLKILTQAEYEEGIELKDLQSTYPAYAYLAASQPYHILALYPVPDAPYTLRLLPWQAHSPYTHWDHVLEWPNGYGRAMIWNLACDLGPQYSIEPTPALLRTAEQSKRAIYPVNAEIGRLSLNPRRPVGATSLGYPPGFLSGRG